MDDLCARSWFGKEFGDIYKDKPSCFISELGKGVSPPYFFDFNFDSGDHGTSIRQLFEDNKLAKDKKSINTYEITYGFKTTSQADMALSRAPVVSPLPSRVKKPKELKARSDAALSASTVSATSSSSSAPRKRAGSVKAEPRGPPRGSGKFRPPPPMKSEPYFSIRATRSLRSGKDRRGSDSELDKEDEEATAID